MLTLTVVINEANGWCADEPGNKINAGKAEDWLLTFSTLHLAFVKIDDRTVGDDCQETTEDHNEKKEVHEIHSILVILCHQVCSTLPFLVH